MVYTNKHHRPSPSKSYRTPHCGHDNSGRNDRKRSRSPGAGGGNGNRGSRGGGSGISPRKRSRSPMPSSRDNRRLSDKPGLRKSISPSKRGGRRYSRSPLGDRRNGVTKHYQNNSAPQSRGVAERARYEINKHTNNHSHHYRQDRHNTQRPHNRSPDNHHHHSNRKSREEIKRSDDKHHHRSPISLSPRKDPDRNRHRDSRQSTSPRRKSNGIDNRDNTSKRDRDSVSTSSKHSSVANRDRNVSNKVNSSKEPASKLKSDHSPLPPLLSQDSRPSNSISQSNRDSSRKSTSTALSPSKDEKQRHSNDHTPEVSSTTTNSNPPSSSNGKTFTHHKRSLPSSGSKRQLSSVSHGHHGRSKVPSPRKSEFKQPLRRLAPPIRKRRLSPAGGHQHQDAERRGTAPTGKRPRRPFGNLRTNHKLSPQKCSSLPGNRRKSGKRTLGKEIGKDNDLKASSLEASDHLKALDPSVSMSLAPAVAKPKLKLDELTEASTADDYDELTKVERWVRSAPDELYYDRQVDGFATATERTQTLCEKFESTLLVKAQAAREEAERLGDDKMTELIKQENEQITAQKAAARLKRQQQRAEAKCCHHNQEKKAEPGCSTGDNSKTVAKKGEKAGKKCCAKNKQDDSSSSSSSSSGEGSSDSDSESESSSLTRSDTANRELERRKHHPRRLHQELWHNDPGLMNDGPVCRCSAKARRFGIRHGYYPGENAIPHCNPFSNNKSTLFHYRITISPPKNFLISTPTVINHDGHEYIFEGFSIFSHYPLDLSLPPCKVIRFNIKYDVFVEEERFPESFCVKELLLFETYLFREILELVDLKYNYTTESPSGCAPFHFLPRFVRQLPDNGQEILSMNRVLIHLLKGDRELVREEDLHKLYTVEQSEWQNFADRHKGSIVTKWGMKPCALRVDQIDRDISGQEVIAEDGIPFPLIVHFGIRPPQLSYAGNASYQRAWRRYVKYRHLLSNMPKPSPSDKLKLLQKEMKLQAMRTASNMKRDVTVAISAKGFRTTGLCCDLVQHAMLIPVLVAHLRFHKCLETLETGMVYRFQNRYLLQLAMTHPSYRENFGTNPDHARNSLTNCGIRQPEYGDRRIHYASTRKRGINTLINIMAKFGADQETESGITHNERLEFLGDAVVEFTTSVHLFHIFPDLEEGGLATYRAAIVQNQHLAVLAQTLGLDQYMLYAHGSDLCHDSELRHAMANCFEALMGALFLDGNILAADRVFGTTLFGSDPTLLRLWANYPKHPLQREEPNGDRHWVESHEVLQKLATFEENIGVNFNHIRLLARAFTDRSLGYNNLTKGSNQRLEFLGDTVLQLISSEYLYRHFPDHHEGHLSLLRSSLVNNRTQSLVCEDLGMPQYAMRGDPKADMKTKDKADLLEAFLGALFIDKGLNYCVTFCQVCFFPRLSDSITKQEWNDPKSKLQQCCLTLRAMDGREPDIPVYKVTESLGPTNTRTYIVAVYFRSKRLATAQGHSIQEAEMNAAAEALEQSGHLFPQLHHQRRIMDKTSKKGH